MGQEKRALQSVIYLGGGYMYDDFVFINYALEGEPSLEVIARKVAQLGKVVSFGGRGFRLIPDNPLWPTTYFNPNGTIDVLTKDLYLDDIELFVEHLSRMLGIAIRRNSHPAYPAPDEHPMAFGY